MWRKELTKCQEVFLAGRLEPGTDDGSGEDQDQEKNVIKTSIGREGGVTGQAPSFYHAGGRSMTAKPIVIYRARKKSKRRGKKKGRK